MKPTTTAFLDGFCALPRAYDSDSRDRTPSIPLTPTTNPCYTLTYIFLGIQESYPEIIFALVSHLSYVPEPAPSHPIRSHDVSPMSGMRQESPTFISDPQSVAIVKKYLL